jgi:hypothetical protein
MSCGVQSPDRQRRTPTEHTIQRGDIPRYVIVKAAYSHARARAQGTHDTRDRVFRGAWSQYTHCAQHTATGADSELHADALAGSRDETPRHSPRPRESSERRETATALYFPEFQKAGSTLKVLYLLLWCSAHHHLYAARRQIARYAALQLIVCGFVDSGLLRGFPQPRGGPNYFGPGGSSRPPRGDCGCARGDAGNAGHHSSAHKACGPLPILRRTPHAARRTPHAARRTGFCLMGDAETHGATLVLNSPSGLACKDLPGSHRSAA